MRNEMYCPACGNDHIAKTPNNTKAADFICDVCGENYELKSTKSAVGKKILDGAFYAALERISGTTNPNLFVMRYSQSGIIDLTLIPKHFFTPDILQRRNALSQNARRSGYIGSFILYDRIPDQGKIAVIQSQNEIKKSSVIANYQKAMGLKIKNLSLRGWLMDILNCVNNLNSIVFSINDIYSFEGELSAKHPENNNIKAKIRQQLQFLRDRGFIKFLGDGLYQKI